MAKKLLFVAALVAGVATMTAFQSSDKIDQKQLKDALSQLGYEVKELESTAGKEKYQFTLERGGLNIPVAAEISPSGTYIWFTVFCKAGVPAGDKAVALLRRNGQVQPTQFYMTKSDKVMAGLCVENKGVTNALLRQRAERLAQDVADSKDDWQ